MTTHRPRPIPGAPAESTDLPRNEILEQLPVLVLEPHSRCNCRCLMCDIWKVREPRELEAAEIRRWAPEWRRLGVRRVVLSGGEPLMHSDLESLCAPLLEAGIGITLLSTGLLLQRHAAAVARCADELILSLDGPPEVHDRIRRVPGAYSRLEEGVRAVRRVRSEMPMSARCTVQRANFRELRRTVVAAHALGLARISFLAADVSTEAFNRPGGWDGSRAAEVALAANELPALDAELEAMTRELGKDFADGFIAETPESLRRKLIGSFAALAGLQEAVAPECNAPWVSAVVEPDGAVRPCFFHKPIGNLREAGSLEAVLNGPRAVAFRRQLKVAEDPICRRCVCSLNLRQGVPSP